MALLPGLCSITFRALGWEEVVEAAAVAGLGAVEWGADVHVPPGDTARAEAVARRCADAGLATPSYGSYLLAGDLDTSGVGPVLDAAEALGATTVRVWTPFGTRPVAPAGERRAVVDAVAAVASAAASRGLEVALEFHPGTLTETAASAGALIDDVGAPNLWTYWQPPTGHTDDARCLAELDGVMARLAHVHAFSWGPAGIGERWPLDRRARLWAAVVAAVAAPGAWGRDRAVYLEYVADDALTSLPRDAATLRALLAGAQPPPAR